MEESLQNAAMNMPDGTMEKRTVAEGEIIAGRFKITARVSTGSRFDVFIAEDATDKVDVIVKVSKTSKEKFDTDKALYETLNDAPQGFQKLITSGVLKDSPDVSFLVIDKLGKTIKEYWDTCGNCFNCVTVARIAIQVLERLRFAHERGVVHRNITPENLVMGNSKETETIIYLTGFKTKKPSVGECDNPRQVSVTGETDVNDVCFEHMYDSSRRGDLMSLGLTMVKLIKGSHSHEKGTSETDKEHDEKKNKLSLICEGLPEAFHEYFSYLCYLGLGEKPDYDMLVLLFKGFLEELKEQESIEGVALESILSVEFEWMIRPEYVTPK